MNRKTFIFNAMLLLLPALAFGQSSQGSQEKTTPQGKAIQQDKTTQQDKAASTEPQKTTKSDAEESTELSPLISVKELAELLKSGTAGVKLLEPGRDSDNHTKGHLPNGQFLHWVNDMTCKEDVACYKNPSAEEFQKLMSRLGIENDDRIVIYDRLANRLSTRLYWTLKYFGHEKVQVLNGGIYAWAAENKLSKDVLKVAASKYKIAATHEKILAEMKFVEDRLEDPKSKLIDGRPAEQYSGEVAGTIFHTGEEHTRKGHIPGAINVVWKDNFNKDGTFKTTEELKALYKEAGVLPDQCVITYCNEGLHAAPPWFVLTQLLDFKDVRLYDSSMAEWSNSKNPLKKKTDKPK